MTYEEMERTLVQLADLQRDNQHLLREAIGAMKRLSDLVVSYAEQQNGRITRLEDGLIRLEDGLIRLEEGLIRLTALVEAFVKGSRNGGKQE